MATPTVSNVNQRWKENWWWWEFFRLSYVGGREYMSPSITQRWYFPKRSTTDQGVDRLRFEEGDLYSFLFRHNREENGDYDQRVARSFYRNLTRPIVDTYAAHVLGKSVLRDYGNAPMLGDLAKRIDGGQSTVAEFMTAGLKWAQVFGHVFCVVDMPELQPGEIVTRADEKERGMLPYASWYSPLAVLDWEVDRYGRFVWVKTVESDLRKIRLTSQQGQPSSDSRLYRVWYADHWELLEGARGGEGMLLAEGPNPIGRVPIEVLYGERTAGETQPIGRSRIGDITMLNREIYNLDSLKQDIMYSQAFAFFMVPDKSGLVTRVDVGLHRALVYDPESGTPSFVGPPVDYVQNIRDEIADLVLQIRALAGLSRGVGEQSIAARSGDALLIETQDKAVMLLALAHEAEDFENRLFRLAGKWLGVSDWDGAVRYPESYDIRSLMDDLDVAMKYGQLDPPATAKQHVLEGVTRRLLGHLPARELAAIVSEISNPTVTPEAKTDLLTPTDMTDAVTINEARAQVGLGPLLLVTGGEDPDGSMTVSAFREKRATLAKAAANGEKKAEAPKMLETPEMA